MNATRVLAARFLRIGAPLLMLTLVPAVVAAPSPKKYVLSSTYIVQDQASNGIGTDHTTEVTNTYDQHGYLLYTEAVNSGNFVQVQTTTYTNNNKGDPISSISEIDNDGDSIADLTLILTYTYDNQGKRIAIDQQVLNENLELTIIRHTSLSYDAQNNLILVVTTSYLPDATGIFDAVADQIITVENTWDGNGQLLQSVTTADLNGDLDHNDQGESIETRVNTFDASGRVASSLITAARINNGATINTTATSTFTYDPRGLLNTLVTTADTTGDGITDVTSAATYTWVKK